MPNRAFSLDELKALAEGFARQQLTAYSGEVRKAQRPLSSKEINDALWGTISLAPAEVALLDSPLIQRLRWIRQLGVVHWVYPGAVHTRFEHTLGFLHQVQNLTSALNAL